MRLYKHESTERGRTVKIRRRTAHLALLHVLRHPPCQELLLLPVTQAQARFWHLHDLPWFLTPPVN